MSQIITPRLVLRPLEKTDNVALATLANNRNIWLNLRNTFPYPYTLEKADTFLESIHNHSDAIRFAITQHGEFVGMIGLHPQQDVYAKTAELGYWIGEPFWNQGIISEAIPYIISYGFEHSDWVKIFAGVYDYNIASMRVLEKAGFTKEGVLQKAVFKDGKLLDEHRYAIFRS